jgi:hypothetical protein
MLPVTNPTFIKTQMRKYPIIRPMFVVKVKVGHGFIAVLAP